MPSNGCYIDPAQKLPDHYYDKYPLQFREKQGNKRRVVTYYGSFGTCHVEYGMDFSGLWGSDVKLLRWKCEVVFHIYSYSFFTVRPSLFVFPAKL